VSINKDTIEYVASLARIELQPKELEKLSLQLQTILDFIDRLKKLEVKDVPATSHILPINNVFKPDDRADSLSVQEALENAPAKNGDFFVVPKIID
jgi:aspartyl-tRNA(Asn)/glutamyl-tRNA(Gln) amidotransferase subunit C